MIAVNGVKIGDFGEPRRQTVRQLYEKDTKEFDIRQKMLYNRLRIFLKH